MAGESESGNNIFSRFTGLFRSKDSQPKPTPSTTTQTEQPTLTESPKSAPVITSPETTEDILTNKMQELAGKTLAELDAIEGKKGLVVIIDDDPARNKIETANLQLERHKQVSDVNYVMRHFYEGDDGITFYVEFRKLSSDMPVVILMDGKLGHGDAGYRVTNRLLESTTLNHLPMPYIIGNSNDDMMNSDIQRAAPNSYLGDFFHTRKENSLAILDSKL